MTETERQKETKRQTDRDRQTKTDREGQAGRKAARLKDIQAYRKSVLREDKNEDWFGWRSRHSVTTVSFCTTRLPP